MRDADETKASLGQDLPTAEMSVVAGSPLTAAGQVGPYRLLEKIGAGGMGEVWLAEQLVPIRRRVALKLIKAGMDTREVVARFESERRTLAIMDHPAIAKIFDAGSTPEGRPYFAMEYVPGLPITDYCDKHRLTVRERLELFRRVCEGVQHAHQKAIIHRDLKPSNVLVCEVDGEAMPKVIDFGVAKALASPLTAQTMFTRLGAMIGTPEYMSPEQADRTAEDVDTRTDVYSLGVILYELLVGTLPLDFRKWAFDEMLRRLREEDPPRPSAKLSTLGELSQTIAEKRQSEQRTLGRQLRGDLDSIALRALEKDRGRRYGSPTELAADIQRHLRNEPVSAGPSAFSYRAWKFARRNSGVLGVAAAFILLLLLGAGVSLWQAMRAVAQRDRADREAAVSKAVNQFLQEDLLAQASPASQGSPNLKPDPDVKVRTLLDRAAEKVGKRFDNKPLVESAIRGTIGTSYFGLGLVAKAEQEQRRAYDLSRHFRGPEERETIELLQDLSTTLDVEGRRPEALEAIRKVVEVKTRKLGQEDASTLQAMQLLGLEYGVNNRLSESEAVLNKNLEIQSRRFGPDSKDALNTSESLASIYLVDFKYSQAEGVLRRAVEISRRLYGEDHPNTQSALFGIGRVLFGEGKYDEAEKAVAEVLAVNQRVLGPDHMNTLSTATMLGRIYLEQRRFTDAATLMEATAKTLNGKVGPTHPWTVVAKGVLGMSASSNGDLSRAERIWRDAIREAGDDPKMANKDNVFAITELLGQNLTQQGRYRAAEHLLREALVYRQMKFPNHWRLFRAKTFLGAALVGEERYAEAEPLLMSGYEGMRQCAREMPLDEKKWMISAGKQIEALHQKWPKPI